MGATGAIALESRPAANLAHDPGPRGEPIRVAIVGGTGYAGGELIRLLDRHPYAEIVGISGRGTLTTDGGELPLARGSAVLIPYASGNGVLEGDVEALRARPPDPGAGEGEW